VDIGQEQGLVAAACLRGSGLSQTALSDPECVVQAQQELQVVRNLLATLGADFPLALEAGARSHPTAYGIWGFAWLSSASVREAIEIGLRYLTLTSIFCHVVLRQTPDTLELVGEDEDLPVDLRGFLIERDAAAVRCLMQDLLGEPLQLAFVQFKARAPVYRDRAAELFGVMPMFAQERNCVSVYNATLDRRLPQANPMTLRSCELECQKLLARHRARDGFSGQVRNQLLRQPGQIPDMARVAVSLNLTPRSLRRRLVDEGTTFDTLRDEVRAAIASELLAQTMLSVDQIAERLGYSELSCFSRAFKRWSGTSPRGFRKRGFDAQALAAANLPRGAGRPST